MADPGTQAQAAEEKPGLRPLALAITVLGLVVFALMVGLVTESVTEQVDSFKKGRSKVLLLDLSRTHTVMRTLSLSLRQWSPNPHVILSHGPRTPINNIYSRRSHARARRARTHAHHTYLRTG